MRIVRRRRRRRRRNIVGGSRPLRGWREGLWCLCKIPSHHAKVLGDHHPMRQGLETDDRWLFP
jgi:hypothetical protein